MTPKGMRLQSFSVANGDAVHVYSNDSKLYLQIRHGVPTEVNIAAPSFKVAVELSAADALAIAGELLGVAAHSLRKAGAIPAQRGSGPRASSHLPSTE
ncbi:MAG: hypothetical protein ABSE73_01435 [Planctomycetota bacterium]